MNILTVCAEGNNRSVQFSHLLKYLGHDTIPIGLNTTTIETLKMLYNWADVIVVTDASLSLESMSDYKHKIKVWNVGSDKYPRPFNPILYSLAAQIIKENPLRSEDG